MQHRERSVTLFRHTMPASQQTTSTTNNVAAPETQPLPAPQSRTGGGSQQPQLQQQLPNQQGQTPGQPCVQRLSAVQVKTLGAATTTCKMRWWSSTLYFRQIAHPNCIPDLRRQSGRSKAGYRFPRRRARALARRRAVSAQPLFRAEPYNRGGRGCRISSRDPNGVPSLRITS